MITDKNLERFAALMVEKIKEVCVSDWKKPWFTQGTVGVPQNLSGRAYHSINRLLLYCMMDKYRYSLPVFLTFNQAKSAGVMVTKGSTGFPVVYYDMVVKHMDTGRRIEYSAYKLLDKQEQAQYKVIPFQKTYTVFNIEQTNFKEKFPQKWEALVSRLQPEAPFVHDGTFHHPTLDATIVKDRWLCPIETIHQDRAYFSPMENKIVLPLPEQFINRKEFYMTALHEMAHSTGPGLGREFGIFGSPKYAREELVAEFSSAVVGRDMGLFLHPREENARYLKSWLSVISDNPKDIMPLLGDVGKACKTIEEKLEANLTTTSTVIPEQVSEEVLTAVKTSGIDPGKVTKEQWTSLLKGRQTTLGSSSGKLFMLAKAPVGYTLKAVNAVNSLTKSAGMEM